MGAEVVKYETDRGEVVLSPAIIRQYLVQGQGDVSDQEVMMFLKLCQYQRLNPFLREAYLIKYSDKVPATIVIGFQTFLNRAAKSPLCKGYSAGVVIEKEGKVEQRVGTLVVPGETLIGGWAKVYRKDWQLPVEISVGLKEYVRYTKEGQVTKSWKEMPATLIVKVALSHGIRQAIPEETENLYTAEEMPVEVTELSEEPVVFVEETMTEEEKQDAKPFLTVLQLRRLFGLAKAAGLSPEEMKAQVKRKYGVLSLKQLTQGQYEEYTTSLEKIEFSEEPASFTQEEMEEETLPPEGVSTTAEISVEEPLDKKARVIYWGALVNLAKDLGHDKAWLTAAIHKRFNKSYGDLTHVEVAQIGEGLQKKLQEQNEKPITLKEAQERAEQAGLAREKFEEETIAAGDMAESNADWVWEQDGKN